MANADDPAGKPIRLPPSNKPSMQHAVLFVLAITSGAMLLLAVPNLIPGTGIGAWLKAFLLAVSGTAVAYGVNRLAIERGAPLAVIGYKSAAIASLTSLSIVGGGLFLATYSGLVWNSVRLLMLELHGAALHESVTRQGQAAANGTRIQPAIAAIVSDLTGKSECEARNSCVSGNGNGGRGPVARMLGEQLRRAQGIAEQVSAGSTARVEITGRLEALLARYQAILGSGESSVDEKW